MRLHVEAIAPTTEAVISRRRLLWGAVSLVGVATLGAGRAFGAMPGVKSIAGGSRPTFVPEPDSKDPVAHAVAENLFWLEQMMEHALFFTLLMPGEKLTRTRQEAESFRTAFADQLVRAKGVDGGNAAAFNRASIDMTQRFVDYKERMRQEQVAGRLHSLTWPTFFEHTAREGQYFIRRLQRLSKGDVRVDPDEAARFWTLIMGEHAGFIAHLLDPNERALVEKAMKTSDGFAKLHGRPADDGRTLQAVEDILDFKIAAEQGIEAGTIRSIIDPALADHVRREAIKAAEELRRAA